MAVAFLFLIAKAPLKCKEKNKMKRDYDIRRIIVKAHLRADPNGVNL